MSTLTLSPHLLKGILWIAGLIFPALFEAEPVVESYTIDVTFRPEQGHIEAVADVSFVADGAIVDTLEFYLHGELHVDYVEVDRQRLETVQEKVYHRDDYSLIANRTKVALSTGATPSRIRVGYTGHFNPSVVSARSNYMRIDRAGVFLRSLGYSLWFPVFVKSWRESHSVSFPSVKIRTPIEFTAVFAGDRGREYQEDGLRVSEWSATLLDLFDAQITARRYDVLIDGRLHLYHTRDSTARAMAVEILDAARRLESLYRTHYRKGVSAGQIHIMQMPRYGNIASGNVMGISDEVWNQFDMSAWQGRTVAHELVHSFVQPPRSPELAALVIEGFPSYFHLPALAETLGEAWYLDYVRRIEGAYVEKRRTGKSRRGRLLPPEKPILQIGVEEIGTYKDVFVLSDRTTLFLDYVRRRLGNERFFDFASDLLNRGELNYDVLVTVVESYLPGSRDEVFLWLKTTDFPDTFRSEQR